MCLCPRLCAVLVLDQILDMRSYEDLDDFEEDMSTMFENARQFYEPDSVEYVDAEVLQELFWEVSASVAQEGEMRAL